MLLTEDHPDYDNILVFFNDKLARGIIAANDEEGWIEIPDAKRLAPLHLSPNTIEDGEPEEWEHCPVKRLKGKVEFRKLD